MVACRNRNPYGIVSSVKTSGDESDGDVHIAELVNRRAGGALKLEACAGIR
jgi:hypothetical protein